MLQFGDQEERLQKCEFQNEDLQGEIQRKNRQISDLQENLNEFKVELATLREQHANAEKEVRFVW